MTWKIIDVTISLSDTNGVVTCVKLILRNSLHNEYYNALRLFVCIVIEEWFACAVTYFSYMRVGTAVTEFSYCIDWI